METIFQVGLSNAVAALVLAFLAAGVTWTVRRPALSHSLWLLVLIKLVTPPLGTIPVPLPSLLVGSTTEVIAAPPAVVALESANVDETASAGPEFAMEGELLFTNDRNPALGDEEESLAKAVPVAGILPEVTPVSIPSIGPTSFLSAVSVWRAVAATWIYGSVLWFLFAAIRIWRLNRLIKCGRPVPESIRDQAEELAKQIGLSRCPELLFVPGTVSPMLWAMGGSARLLIPYSLWPKLSVDKQETLLTHELAHWKRRDHWVRVLELLVTGLFWWHPVVWWARWELREAEEACCDAWVVWALPKSTRAYAVAIVDTLDFLDGGGAVRLAEASGIGHVASLKRRLTMIMRGTTQRALTWGGVLAVLGLGVMLLPWLPTQAQDDRPPPRDPGRSGRPDGPPPPRGEQRPDQPGPARERPVDPERAAQVDKARKEIQDIESAMRDMSEKMRQLEGRMREAHRRMAEAGGDPRSERPLPPPSPRRDAGSPGGLGGLGGGIAGRVREIENRLDQVVRELENLRRDFRQGGPPMGGPRGERRVGPGGPGGGPGGGGLPPPRGDREGDGDRNRLERRPPPPAGGPGGPDGGRPDGGRRPPPPDGGRRPPPSDGGPN